MNGEGTEEARVRAGRPFGRLQAGQDMAWGGQAHLHIFEMAADKTCGVVEQGGIEDESEFEWLRACFLDAERAERQLLETEKGAGALL